MTNEKLVASYQRSVCVKSDRNSKKKHFPILTENLSVIFKHKQNSQVGNQRGLK